MEQSAKTFGTFFFSQFVDAGVFGATDNLEAAAFGLDVAANLQKSLGASDETIEEAMSDTILKALDGRLKVSNVHLVQAKRFIMVATIRCCQDAQRRARRIEERRTTAAEAEDVTTTHDIDQAEALIDITKMATHLNETADTRSADWVGTIIKDELKTALARKWGVSGPGVRKFEERHMEKFQLAASTYLV